VARLRQCNRVRHDPVMAHSPSRSLEPITKKDLAALGEIARADREELFETNERWALYRRRLLCVCLCQGAALRFIDGRNGIKDLDVWTFFARSPKRPFRDPALYCRNQAADFGPSRFGRTHGAPDWVTGRRVDLLSRSLHVSASADPVESVRAWLRRGREDSARLLAEKAVVMIEPRRGAIVWPEKATRRAGGQAGAPTRRTARRQSGARAP
jgi:hypothetical protein